MARKRSLLCFAHLHKAPDEDGTTEDISEIRELDSLQSDTLTLHSADGGSQGKGRTAAAGQQDADKAECAREKLFQPHQIPTGKMPPAIEAVLRGTWPFEKALWHSSPASMGMPFKNNNQVYGEAFFVNVYVRIYRGGNDCLCICLFFFFSFFSC